MGSILKAQTTPGALPPVRPRLAPQLRPFWSIFGRGEGGCSRGLIVQNQAISLLRVTKVSTVTGMGGSGSRNAELSWLWDLRLVITSQKCQQSEVSGGGFWPDRGMTLLSNTRFLRPTFRSPKKPNPRDPSIQITHLH